MSITWNGVQRRDSLHAGHVLKRDQLADAARDGNWGVVLDMVEADRELANASRVGGSSGYTPLHQAGWHGAPASVVGRLLAAGAWRTVQCTGGDWAGETASAIAARRGHPQLTELLAPVPVRPVPPAQLAALNWHLHQVIHGRVHDMLAEHRVRLPELGPLTEVREGTMWFPVPGFYGGFSIELLPADPRVRAEAELSVESWSRVIGGSGQRHRVTGAGADLLDQGFV